jgi:hypothetical protein
VRTLAGKVLQAIRNPDVRKAMPTSKYAAAMEHLGRVCSAGQHFALDVSAEDLKAFAQAGVEQVFAGQLPYPAMTVTVGDHVILIWQDADDRHMQLASCEFNVQGYVGFPNYMMEIHPTGDVLYGFFDQAAVPDFSLEDRAACRHNLKLDLAVVGALCGALSCKNVTAEVTNKGKTPKENWERERKGKARVFDTHTLVVHATRTVTGETREGGGHASPRQHLRRGHIRRLPNGNIWVQSCVVGDPSKGFLRKDYRVAA